MIKLTAINIEQIEVAGNKVASIKDKYSVWLNPDVVQFVYKFPSEEWTLVGIGPVRWPVLESVEQVLEMIYNGSTMQSMKRHLDE